MLIDTESTDLLPMERAMLRPIAERLEATARLRCMGEDERPVVVLTIDATHLSAPMLAHAIEQRATAQT